jgi:hypothetical protein
MTKYNIEGGVDFYAELYKSLDIEDEFEADNNVCLITNEPLTDKHVVMDCGHKFNYIPIFKDILNHKQKFNGMEGGNGKLGMNQIRCPYCRKKQDTLLPYYEDLGLTKVNGVNFYDPSIKPSYNCYSKGEQCGYKYPNENYDPTLPESNTNNKYLTNMKCGHYYATKIQIYNPLNESQPITYGDETCYCYNHKKIMIKQYKTLQKQKEKDEAKALKLKAKEEAKEAKELEKQKAKEEKQKAKAAKLNKKKPVENVILGPSNVVLETNEGCVAILKSGPNKGHQCGCTIASEALCGRHFKIKHNIIINN